MPRILKILRRFFFVGLILGGVGFLGAVSLFAYYFVTLPTPQDLTSLRIAESTKIYDRTNAVLLYDIHGEQKRTIIAQDDIPSQVKFATIVAEDDEFYRHLGVDWKGVLRAVLANLRGQTIVQGGSTITQQLVKNVFLSPEVNFTRKIKEAIVAFELERRYSKDRILAWYLNQVPYGSNAYGVEAAAQTYFAKGAADLTLAQSALLASLPKAPTTYSPYGSNLDALFARQHAILERMNKLGYITGEEYATALEEPIEFQKERSAIRAPHFVMYIKEYLEKYYGEEYLQTAGLRVQTTLDWDLQQKAEEIVREHMEQAWKTYRGANAALVALDPRTGHILAMVGSKDYFGDPFPEDCLPGKTCAFDPQVNVSVRPRQPGSSFKPIAYAQAFTKGYTPDTILFDVPTEFNPYCSPDGTQEKDQYGLDCYHPQNYTETFSGPLTMKDTLARSLNVPSVKTLYLAGVEGTVELARRMGIASLGDANQYGLSLVLGGGELTLLEETSAYGVFAAGGVWREPLPIMTIYDAEGRLVEELASPAQTVLDKDVAHTIGGILSSDELRAPVFGAGGALHIPGIPAAAKTGTTQKYRDAWTVGYTWDVVVGVWTGNNNGAFMRASGVSAAAPMWNQFVKYIYKRTQPDDPKGFRVGTPQPMPELAKSATGKPVLDGLLASLGGYHTILSYISKDDPLKDGDSRGDTQFSHWEWAVRAWAAARGIQENPVTTDTPGAPGSSDNSSTANASLVSIDILSPSTFEISSSGAPFEARISSPQPLGVVRVLFAGQLLFAKTFSDQENQTSFSVSLTLPFPSQAGPVLTVDAQTKEGLSASRQIPFAVTE